ncbi:polyhydroxybutyrate depolymerase [uncultured Tateyamaria sp.]|uniref:alpha/beta hydrolase family esterase n=1 Tax=Tateyamaria sp. 1078 TaxID=3417464 RepID=UPI0026293491|nr:polyhydroxybutyrate depolymerase [uncultured Tateyamaria sp.]
MRRFVLTLATAGLFATGVALSAAAQGAPCGDAETPCEIAGGDYHYAVPTVTPKGIVMHLHGGGGRGRGLLTSGLARAALARGYVFVAPNGWHPENRWQRDWSVTARGTDHNRDDKVFLANVMADVRTRTGVTEGMVLLAGFSRGGSMVWDMACQVPDFADAFAPLAGAFWDDLPASCAAPVRLFHTHGWNDRTVPLEGRSFGGGAVVQGDVWASLKILRETNGCDARQPEKNSYDADLWLRHWTDCAAGEIQLMLHKGGHGAPQGWAARIMDWFEATPS